MISGFGAALLPNSYMAMLLNKPALSFFLMRKNRLEGFITPFLTRESKNFETPDFMDIYGHLWTFGRFKCP